MSSEAKKVDFVNDKSFLGHPKGLGTTTSMQAMNAFSHYGMSAILVYYLYATVSNGGLGFEKGLAAQLTSVYVAMTTIAGVIGGYVADRFIGVRKAILIGWIFRVISFLCLAIPSGGTTFYIANQCLLIISASCVGQSLYALVGKMYTKTEPRRDGAFTLMYVMNNVGTISPFITGALADKGMYHYGFLLSAIASLVGLIVYLLTQKSFGTAGLLPDDPAPIDKRKKMISVTFGSFFFLMFIILLLLYFKVLTADLFVNFVGIFSVFLPFAYIIRIAVSKKITSKERKKLIPFVIIFIGSCATLTIWGLAASIFLVFAASRVDNTLFGMSFSPAAWITISSFFSIIFGSCIGALWTKLGSKSPSTPVKFGIGTMFWGASAIFLSFLVFTHSDTVRIAGLAILAFWAILIFGESFTSPLGFGFSTSMAPHAFATQMVTIWQLGLSTGAGLASLIINFYVIGDEAVFFLINGVVVALIGLVLILVKKPIMKIVSE